MNHQSKLLLFDFFKTICTHYPQIMWNSPIVTKVEMLKMPYDRKQNLKITSIILLI